MSERAALPSGVAYVDRTNRAPLRRVIVRRWLPNGWVSELLACGHPVSCYREPFTPRTTKRRCLFCQEAQHAI